MTQDTVQLIALLIRHGRGILTALERWNLKNEERVKEQSGQDSIEYRG